MNCNMRFRPVVCADGRILLPLPGRGLEPQTAWHGVRFGAACLHPDRPWRALFQLVAINPHWRRSPSDPPPVVLLEMGETELRQFAAELNELADEIAIKPRKPKTRKASQ